MREPVSVSSRIKIQFLMGNYDMAKKAFAKAIKLSPTYKENVTKLASELAIIASEQ